MAKATKTQSRATASTGPQAIFPFVLVPAGVAVASKVHDVWKAGQAELKPSEPLVFAVLTSVSQGSNHAVTILCENLGIHGVYLDQFLMTDPKGMGARTKVIPMADTIVEPARGKASFDDASASKAIPPLPVYVPPGQKVCFEVEFDRFTPERLKKGKTFGTLEAYYTVLGIAKSDLKATVEFSVRP